MNEDYNSINNEVNNEVNNEINSDINTTPIDHPINQPIERPIEPTPVEPTPVVNNTSGPKKSKKGAIVLIIIMLLLVLGLGGYYAYSQGLFGGKEETKKEEKKDSTKKSDVMEDKTDDTTENTDTTNNNSSSNTSKDQYMKVDVSNYKKNSIETIGTLTINGNLYNISIKRWNCSTNSVETPIKCASNSDEIISVYIGIASEPGADLTVHIDGGLKEIAILDDRYIFINTGVFNDNQSQTASMMVYDTKNEFKEVEELKLPLYRVYDGYTENNGQGKSVTRTIGYVDNNTFTYGGYEVMNGNAGECAQRYVEYTVKVKDGKFTTEKTFTKDGVQCSAQCS